MSSDDISKLFQVTIGTPVIPRKENSVAVLENISEKATDNDVQTQSDKATREDVYQTTIPVSGHRSNGNGTVVPDGYQPVSTKNDTELDNFKHSVVIESNIRRESFPLIRETDIGVVYGFDTALPARRGSVYSTISEKEKPGLEKKMFLKDDKRASIVLYDLQANENHRMADSADKKLLTSKSDLGSEGKKKHRDDSSDDDEDDEMSEEFLLKLEEEWSEDEEEDFKKASLVAKGLLSLRMFCSRTGLLLQRLTKGFFVTGLLLLLFFIYFGFAMSYRFGDEGSIRLLAVTIIAIIIKLRHRIQRLYRRLFRAAVGGNHFSKSTSEKINKGRRFLRWTLYFVLAGIMIWTLVDVGLESPSNLRSMPGVFIFLLASLLLSERPSAINWHTIYWASGLQFLSALLVLRWTFGAEAVLWTQARLDEFFANSKAGSTLMFGDSYADHYVLFGALPIIFLTNATLTALYYLGAMQLIIKVIGNSLNFVLETSPLESMGVAAGIFMEGVTALLALKPFLKRMTKSQLFLVITSIFSSLGGAYLAILSTLGISLKYLIPAMVVSAPATFAVCKLVVPETKPNRKCDRDVTIGDDETSKYQNLMEAIQMGAIAMVPVVGDIIVSAFTFISVISWVNSTTVWFGDRVGIENLTIEVMASYILYPVALFMGVAPEDCRVIGMLMGYRIFTANFVAFLKMTELKENRAIYDQYMLATNGTGLVEYTRDDIILPAINKTLVNGFIIHERSEAIITYSLCGFSSFLSVAITLGIMITLVPNRRKWIVTITIPALIAGNVANCMTGCFAGIFF